MNDVLSCASTSDDQTTRRDLLRWLLEMLADASRPYPDYPLRLDRSDGFAVCLFETLDVVLNGAALAIKVIDGGFSTESPQLTGLVACRLYATIFEYMPADVTLLLKRCDDVHSTQDAHDCCMRMVQYCHGNFPIRPVWLHLQYMHLKLRYESDRRLAALVDDNLLKWSIGWICKYYTQFTAPSDSFTVRIIVQYSVTRALAQRMQVGFD